MLFCSYVTMSYFNSETNDWLKDWVKRWVQLWSATTYSQFHRKFQFMKKKCLVIAQNYKALKPWWLLNWVSITRMVLRVPQASLFCQQLMPPTWKLSVFVLASPTRPSRARNRPQELCCWFCPQNLCLLEQPLERLPDDLQGLKLGVQILFKPVTDA